MWWSVRTQPLPRLHRRLYICSPLGYGLWTLYGQFLLPFTQELRTVRYGRTDVGRDARTPHGYLPNCRADRWLRLVRAFDDCVGSVLSDHQPLRAPQHLCDATGT